MPYTIRATVMRSRVNTGEREHRRLSYGGMREHVGITKREQALLAVKCTVYCT
jgi:hypothetical protein